MARRKLEQYFAPVLEDGLNTDKAASFGSTLAVTGLITATAGVANTVAPTGPQVRATDQSALVGATVVLTAADSGKVLKNRSTSGSPSWTLPAKADGLYFTFVCANTTAGFTVTASDAIIHLKTSASGTVLTTTTTMTNTQATAIVGDFISIVCDGTAWWTISQSGIFAAS